MYCDGLGLFSAKLQLFGRSVDSGSVWHGDRGSRSRGEERGVLCKFVGVDRYGILR